MARYFPILVLAWLTAVPARAAELKGGPTRLEVRQDGTGLVDQLTFQGRKLLAGRAGFAGGWVRLTPAGQGTIASLFSRQATAVLPARALDVTLKDDQLQVRGEYAGRDVRIPWARTYSVQSADGSVEIREETDFTALPEGSLLAEHVLRLPLILGEDEHQRLFALGGARRVEMFRMDMNDEHRRMQLISSSRAFWPSWDRAGVAQQPNSYQLWRANHADTSAYPIDSGRGAPGWADYSEPDEGLTIRVLDPGPSAPWALMIDAREGVFSLACHPANQLPVAGRDRGRQVFRAVLQPHLSSWPAAHACELGPERYREFIGWLDQGGRYTFLDSACQALGVTVPEGKKTAAQLDDVCRRMMLLERLQPSVILRTFYATDGWRMTVLVRQVLGRSVPREQPLEAWEKEAGLLLERIRSSGVPSP